MVWDLLDSLDLLKKFVEYIFLGPYLEILWIVDEKETNSVPYNLKSLTYIFYNLRKRVELSYNPMFCFYHPSPVISYCPFQVNIFYYHLYLELYIYSGICQKIQMDCMLVVLWSWMEMTWNLVFSVL